MPPVQPARTSPWRALAQPRLVVALLVALAVAAGCVMLGLWQWSRATERADAAARAAATEAAGPGPVGLGTLVAPQSSFSGDDVGRTVWVRGEYDADTQMLVAGRALDGEEGYLVLMALRVEDDGTGGASWAGLSGAPVVPVVRGWVASPHDAPGLRVPDGPVQVTGWLQAGESTSRTAAPANPGGPPLTYDIATSALVNAWGGPIWDGYVVLTQSSPAQVSASEGGPRLLPRPVVEGGTGLNLQSVFYALEWTVFALFALALYVRLARDEVAVARRGGPTAGGTAVLARRGEDPGIAGLPG